MKKHNWTKKQAKSASVPNFGKKYIVEPVFLKLIGDTKNKKILELGSGNGYWLELFSKKGAVCTGIEIAEQQIELAVGKDNLNKIKYIKGDITELEKMKLKESYYDVIIIEHVLLEISSISKLHKIFNGAYRLLKKGGIVVVSDMHPFAPSFNTEKIKTTKGYNYFSSGEIFKCIATRLDGEETIYKDFHWTLEDIVKSITKSGLKVIEIIEPRPSLRLVKKYPTMARLIDKPGTIMFKAIK